MGRIKAKIEKQNYRVTISSASGFTITADEPVANGGTNAGFSPKELLASSLAACTAITLSMYAQHKGWQVNLIEIEIDVEYNKDKNETRLRRNIKVGEGFNEDQKSSLLRVANKCPLHNMLTGSIRIETELL